MKRQILYLITGGLLCSASLFADQQVPWQDPSVNGINREPACAHFIPFSSEAKALSNDLSGNERYREAGSCKGLMLLSIRM